MNAVGSDDGLRVVVVDDDDPVRRSFEAVLESDGLDTLAFASGEAFLATIGDLERVGCVVLDISMPGMTGFEVLRRLRARGIDLPVIFVSGTLDESLRTSAEATDAEAFLVKPTRIETLLRHVRHALRLSSMRKADLSTAGPPGADSRSNPPSDADPVDAGRN